MFDALIKFVYWSDLLTTYQTHKMILQRIMFQNNIKRDATDRTSAQFGFVDFAKIVVQF